MSLKLVDLGFSAEKIAEIAEVSISIVKQWTDGYKKAV